METLVVETPEGLPLTRELAGAGSRSAAALVDLALHGAVALVLLWLVGLLLGAGVLRVLGAGALLALALHPLPWALLGSSTPGKRLLGLEVVDAEGAPADLLQHLLRGLFFPLEAFLLVPVPLGIVLAAATRRHQRLGDLVAGTLVARTRRAEAPPTPYPNLRWATLEARELGLVPALAARFGERDLGLLADLLGRPGLDREAREELLLRAARHFLARLGRRIPEDLSARSAHRQLCELYLFLRDSRQRAAVRR